MLTLLRHVPRRFRAWFHRDHLGLTRVGPVEPKREVTPSTVVAVGARPSDGTSAGTCTGSCQAGDDTPWKGPGMFGGTDYRVWLVEQDTTRLGAECLNEAMILAATEAEALEGALALADPVAGFGLAVQRRRLRAVDYGPAAQPLPGVFPRFQHGRALVLVIGTGADHDGSPLARDATEPA